jgi:PRTRC genetic system protein C
MRLFKFDGVELPDPNPKLSAGEVLSFYAHQYPKMVNADVKLEKSEGNTHYYEISKNIGTKG